MFGSVGGASTPCEALVLAAGGPGVEAGWGMVWATSTGWTGPGCLVWSLGSFLFHFLNIKKDKHLVTSGV